ncbi:MAG: DUF4976 domain-containing protein [Verrucomicrobia bacterium]|nr:MAG: DUF4976 domain-containing protein [Verrucomicrobiota bacterium]
MKRREFLGLMTLAAGAMWTRAVETAAPDRRPLNFVFFLVDDLGARDVEPFGNTFYETPNVTRLAQRGMRFTNAYAACAVCSPSRASIMTGKYPARLHLTDWIPGEKPPPNAKLQPPDWCKHLPLEEVTVAEAFKKAGYSTALIGKWHLGDTDYSPEKQGFDVNIAGGHWGQPATYFSPYKHAYPNLPDGPQGEYLTDRLTDEALKFIEGHATQPFLLHFCHYAVHMPLMAKPEMMEKYSAKAARLGQKWNPAYAAMVESVDQSLGRVLNRLEELKIADHTVVIFMSDNGGQLGATTNVPLRAGKGHPYEGGIREPLIIAWPGVVQAGSACATPVISTDFFPTMLDMAGLPLMPENHCDGVSLAPLLRQTGTLQRPALFWHFPHYRKSCHSPYGIVRQGDWKLIEFYEDGAAELFNLKDDESETKNLAATNPAKTAELKAVLHQWREQVGAQMPTPNPNYRPGLKPKKKAKKETPPDNDP